MHTAGLTVFFCYHIALVIELIVASRFHSRNRIYRCLLVTAFLSVAIACGCRSSDSIQSSQTTPNIILISIDSLRADHLGSYGYSRNTSPTIDQLAEEGLLFEVATSSSSWTLPAHAAMFTGLPDSVHGCDRGSRVLSSDILTVAEALQATGYKTAGFWSGPLLHTHFGLAQGFDEYINCSVMGDSPDFNRDVWRRDTAKSHEDITGPRIVDKVSAWIEASRDRRFFLFIHMWDVHYDYIPPPPYDTLFDPEYSGPIDGRNLVTLNRRREELSKRDLEHLIALYDGEIAWTDWHIRKILEKLDELRIADETVVIVTSDHGEEFFEHDGFGHKRNLYEESIRIPLVIYYPGMTLEIPRIRQPVHITDIAPTILEIAGAEAIPDVTGQSLLHFFGNQTQINNRLTVSELLIDKKTNGSLFAVRAHRWKIVFRTDSGENIGLWNLHQDPLEQRNLIRENHPLKASATSAVQDAIDDIKRLKADFATTSFPSQPLPPDLQEQLQALGYLDDTSRYFVADPNPVPVCDGTERGLTTLAWNLPHAVPPLEIRVRTPDGKLIKKGLKPRGSARTGRRVRDGMKFFVVETSTGETVASLSVQLTDVGCEVE